MKMHKRNLSRLLFLSILMSVTFLFGANVTASSAGYSDDEMQALYEKASEMEKDILASLPFSKAHSQDPFIQASTMDTVKTSYPEIYSGYAVEDGELILKLTRRSKDTASADERKAARTIAKKHGATKIRYVNYTLNELHVLYAKAENSIFIGNEYGINMAALDAERGIVVIGLERLTQENIKNVAKLLGSPELLECVEFSYIDDGVEK